MTRKKLYIIILAILTIVISITVFFIGFRYDSKKIASVRLEKEISAMNTNKTDLEEQKTQIVNRIEEINTELSTKSTINSYFVEAKKKNDELKAAIDELNKKSSELDANIESKKNELSSLGKTKETAGKTYTLKKDEVYTCPDKIPTGRYIAKGNGTIIIYSASGKARINQDLSVAFNNSYTFTLNEKEKIKTTDEISLTETKTE